jgi:hypothetical protein
MGAYALGNGDSRSRKAALRKLHGFGDTASGADPSTAGAAKSVMPGSVLVTP